MKYLVSSSSVVKKNKRQAMDKIKVDTVNAKIDLFVELLKICKEYKLKNDNSIRYSNSYLRIFTDLLMRNDDVITNQEIEDINLEISKYNRIMQYLSIEETLLSHHRSNGTIREILTKFEKLLRSIEKYTDELDSIYKNDLINLSKSCANGLNISDRERKEILRAMNLTQGHWYKCPNGHVYCITECGGAMQESKCSECGAVIGGGSHRLRSDNAVATEMDGARYSAFSDQANLFNYALDRFM